MNVKILPVMLLISNLAFAANLSGKVVAVSDGDSVTVLDRAGTRHKIRLAEIDAPETRQAFGNRSKQSLAQICFAKSATVAVVTKDRYGRTVGRVYCDGTDASAGQVKRGMAWVYTRYAKDTALKELEATARLAKVGLWADVNPVPPWEFRRNK